MERRNFNEGKDYEDKEGDAASDDRSYAETVAATEANQPAEGTSEDFGVTFFIWFFGGITLLILFVVVVVVCSSISAVGVFDAQGEE